MDRQDDDLEMLLRQFQPREPGPLPAVARERRGPYFAVLAAAAAAVVLGFISVSVFRPAALGPDGHAIAENPGGNLFVVSNGVSRVVRRGERIEPGSAMRTAEGAGAVLALADGSRVEMRSHSEMALETENDGVLLELSGGSIIVTASKQTNGHLYVRTKDVTVSVIGTVFLVNAEQDGSRVAVIQGEVRVQQGTVDKKLRPGEQVATNPIMPAVPVSEELAWSQNAAAHIALLQRSLALLQEPVIASPPPFQNPAEASAQFEATSILQGGTAPSGSGQRGRLYAGACGGGSPVELDPKRFTATLTLLRLIALAYGKKCWAASEVPLISGGPAWIRSELFQIQSVIPDGSPSYTGLQLDEGDAPKLQSMLQAMLADRFKLVLHRETKDVPVYNLVLVKPGKVKLSDDQTPPAPIVPPSIEELRERAARGAPRPPQQRGTYSLSVNPQQGKVSISASAIPMSALINTFQGQEGRLVIDRTGFNGLIDISPETMNFAPFTLSEPSMWPEIVAQLGMKLEPAKGPAEVLVVDSVEKPSEN